MIKTGRKSKFNKTIETISLNLALQGKTNKQIAEIVNVGEATFQRWLSINTEFREELQLKKEEHDKELVETSLLEKCKSRIVTEFRTRKDTDGKVIETLKIEKEVSADTGAIKLFLENRYSERYNIKEKNELNIQQNILNIDVHSMTLRELQDLQKESVLGSLDSLDGE